MARYSRKRVPPKVGVQSSFFFAPAVQHFLRKGAKERMVRIFKKVARSFIRMKFLKPKPKYPGRQLCYVWAKLEGGIEAVQPLVYFIHKRTKRRYRKLPKAISPGMQRRFAWSTLASLSKFYRYQFLQFLAREINLLYIQGKSSLVAQRQLKIHQHAYQLFHWRKRWRRLPYFDVKSLFPQTHIEPLTVSIYVGDLCSIRDEYPGKKLTRRFAAWVMYKRYRKKKILQDRKLRYLEKQDKRRFWIPEMELYARRINLYYERKRAKRPYARFEKRIIRRWRILVDRRSKRRKLWKMITLLNPDYA